ncbi:MAG TPA: methionyl-tRNA formyltransferase, partial [Candidatus Binatia bacterium]|nr:methionyl-tRNA formyltransferase [Candidatus Binatia bacterium]
LLQPPDLREPELELAMRRIGPAIAVVVAYGQFIPKDIRSLPLHKTVNVHFSLLPAYRGAAPVQRAIENGDQLSGITIFEIGARMDAGDIWAQEKAIIRPDDTCLSLQQRLGELAAPLLLQTMEHIFSAKISKTPQDDSQATLARPVQKSEGRVDWNSPARQIVNRLRAFTPWPGLFYHQGDRQIKIIHADVAAAQHGSSAGDILGIDDGSVMVACGLGSVLAISMIQPEGKKAMTPGQYSLGNRFPGRLQ